ncbi:MAG: hypothetical protein AAF581_11210 [Planctomycetota bacterium]
MTMATRSRITDKGVERHIEYQINERSAERPWIGRIAGKVKKSLSLTEPYIFTGTAPPMGPRTAGDKHDEIKQYPFEIKNGDFSTGCVIPGDLIRRGEREEVMKIANQLPTRSIQHWEKLTLEVLENAANNADDGVTITKAHIDGVGFFSEQHPARDDNPNQSNFTDVAVTGSSPANAEEAGTIWRTGIDNLIQMLDDQGEPMNEDASSFTIVIPYTQKHVFWQSMSKEVILSGGQSVDNPVYQYGASEGHSIRLQTSVRMSNSTRFPNLSNAALIFRDDAPGSAVKRQQEYVRPVRYGSGSDWSNDNNQAWKYRIEASRAVGLASWMSCYMVTWS